MSKKLKVVHSSVGGKPGNVSHLNYLLNYLPKITIDLSFQSKARWTMAQMISFINSSLRNMNISRFVIVDLQKCYDNADTELDKRYYKYWLDKGFLYLNIDSNNRTVTFEEFKAGKIRIPHGDYPSLDGVTNFKVDKTNDTYKTMDFDFKTMFDSSLMSLFIVTKATREELSIVFERMNSGEHLNIFEKLNCSYSTTCEKIREITNKLDKIFLESKLFTEVEINRRKLDGWFANVHYLYVNGINQAFSKNVHTNWYHYESVSNKSVKSFVADWKRYIKDTVGNKIKLFHYKWVLFDLFYLITQQERMNKKLSDNTTMVQDFIDIMTEEVNNIVPRFQYPDHIVKLTRRYIEDDLTQNMTEEDKKNKKLMSKIKKQVEKVFEGKTEPILLKSAQESALKLAQLFPFDNLCRGEGGHTPLRLKAYEDAGFDVSKYFFDIDPKRSFTKIEKQGIAVRDGWKKNDGEDFIPETLHDGEFDAGHKVAHGKGGKTEPENGVIEDMSENRSKQMEETVVTQ